ncbi:MAG: protein-L-isoaspartate(D-aspartate) O-methyltransferase [Acidobacteriota bacterium]
MLATIFLSLGLSLTACNFRGSYNPAETQKPSSVDTFKEKRRQMVEQQIRGRGIEDQAVIGAMMKVERHRFVPASQSESAYYDSPLPIGEGQTISQPFIVAYMTEAAKVSPSKRVLEIGTGSGYQAAILGELAREVYTIEIIPKLAERARATLNELGYKNVFVKPGNGYLGWPEHAPFDAIVVTAAPDEVPQALVDQLAINGKMVIPVGIFNQEMTIITKTNSGIVQRSTIPVRFVPMTGKPKN